MDWAGRLVLVTGGASFIGSHLVDQLVQRGATVRVVDDLSSGRLENIQRRSTRTADRIPSGDLRVPGVADDGRCGHRRRLPSRRGSRRPRLRRPAPGAPAPPISRSTGSSFSRAATPASRRSSTPRPAASIRTPPDRSRQSLYLDAKTGPAVRRGQHVRLGEADGGDDAPGVCTRVGDEGRLVPLLHRLRRAWQGEPRGHRDDRPRLRQAGSLRRLGHGRADSQLDVRRRHRQRHDPRRREDRRRHRGEPRDDGADAGDRRGARNHALHRPRGRDRAASRDADRANEPRRGQRPRARSCSAGSRR